PNLLAGRKIVPELLQHEATPENLASASQELLGDSSKRQATRNALLSLRAALDSGGSARAADEILSTLKTSSPSVPVGDPSHMDSRPVLPSNCSIVGTAPTIEDSTGGRGRQQSAGMTAP